MKTLLLFFQIFSYLVYPSQGVDRRVLKENLISACGSDAGVKYYEVADVYLVRECPKEVLKREWGIEKIEEEKKYRLPDFSVKNLQFEIDTLPWYVNMIHMYDREKVGLGGKGVVCGVLDTGLDTQDVYLSRSFSGYFKDAVNDSVRPYDDNGHGTAVSSLIAGEYGVAPDVLLAVCKGFGANGMSDDSTILECTEWFYGLKESGIPLYVINNSWGEPEAQYMITVLQKWDSLGILSSFSAGNNGPFYRMIDAPSVYPITFSIGATTESDTLAWYSSRGPAPDTGIFSDTMLWPVPDWNYTKPDFVAPGDYMYVALPGKNHGIVSGTSFATPVFSGLLCLMKEADPEMGFKEAYLILKNHGVVRRYGIVYPDSGYGFGRIDVGRVMNYFAPKVVYDTFVKLSFPQGIEADYKIYTIDGRLVKEGRTPVLYLLPEDEPGGAYIMKLFLKNHTYTIKFVKIR